jgi:hypothetical protein
MFCVFTSHTSTQLTAGTNQCRPVPSAWSSNFPKFARMPACPSSITTAQPEADMRISNDSSIPPKRFDITSLL